MSSLAYNVLADWLFGLSEGQQLPVSMDAKLQEMRDAGFSSYDLRQAVYSLLSELRDGRLTSDPSQDVSLEQLLTGALWELDRLDCGDAPPATGEPDLDDDQPWTG